MIRMTELGVVIEIDLGVECDHISGSCYYHRVDLCQGAILIDKGPCKFANHIDKLINRLSLKV